MGAFIKPGIYQLKTRMSSVHGHEVLYIQVMGETEAYMLGRGNYMQYERGQGGEPRRVPPEELEIKPVRDNDKNLIPAPSNWKDIIGAEIKIDELPTEVKPL